MKEIRKDGCVGKILGKSGVYFECDGKKYFVDSEILVGPNYNLVLYKKNIKFWEDTLTTISDEVKMDVAQKAKVLFESAHIKVEVI